VFVFYNLLRTVVTRQTHEITRNNNNNNNNNNNRPSSVPVKLQR
jgi:hypothetical protein